ncbi:multidrug efflux SMR transporter [Synechococcus sp. LA31]|uniref:DMT family transporter n=1 Tax=Synechococcus sp. LA31 TaxID=2741953 RepID=UPI001BDDA5BF|nr:multidrug efflux SMR transporter [Synechococcus sp. LA31]QVV68340.1 multidrug efflux SMR transporter [Synechococcus sp. LA31]
MLFGYLFLVAAVLFENLGTAALKGSNGLRKLLPGAVAVFGYIVSFSLMGQALARLPLAIAYSIWSGLGMSVVTLTGILIYNEQFNRRVSLGLALIFAGVLVSNFADLISLPLPGVAR